ncbi:putative catechol o-methyltransferase [Phaeomoniella chlamydospora]|uniref:Putative catechol o-methyltransferase n=1 Tax=Phaeomoniella chlamydospora TaxID=158046 RepID=A0A0G2DSG3_PHACM|nr:putative catechol o-methyltransferase [Phaeomoniella chlamydospora]
MTELSETTLKQLLANVTDSVTSYDGTRTVQGMERRAAIRGAARELFLATSTPEDHVWNQVANMTVLVALRTCLKLGIFKYIPLDGAASLEDIAKAANATTSLVVGCGFLEQTRPDGGDYKHTKFSLSYTDVTVPGPGTFFQAMYDVYLKTTLPLDEWIEKKFKGQYGEPSSNFENPFVSRYGTDGQSAWDVMASIPDVMTTFQLGLKAMDEMLPPAGSFYDFSQFQATDEEPTRIQIVDVGGGFGKVLTEIVQATPALDPEYCVVQDVGNVIEIAHAARGFGARAYYMRFISHDYSDHDIINILGHIAKAMASDSKLLLADCVIPGRLRESTVTAGVLDQLMFCIGGKERTEGGFKSILGAKGLELISVNKIPGSTAAIVEAKLKQQS